MDQDILETFKTFLPAYLTPEQKSELYQELKSFPDNTNYFLGTACMDELLQGDAWGGVGFVESNTGESREVKGLVLSNSCDISLENRSDRPRRVVYAPLLRLSAYEAMLRKGRDDADVENILRDLRRQQVTYAFYLPDFEGMGESLVLLDNVYSLPLTDFVDSGANKIFSLSQYGFYIFLLKLSIHFTRFQEGVARFEPDGVTA